MFTSWIQRGQFVSVLFLFVWAFFLIPQASAQNVIHYSDTLSDSGPIEFSNHTLEFELTTALSPGSVIEITPPPGFTTYSFASSTFGVRNVELYIDGSPRTATVTAAAGVDGVTITPGSPGLIQYELAPDLNIVAGRTLELRIGNHTTNSRSFSQSFSTTTGTTTVYEDVEPILNATTTGEHRVQMDIYDGGPLVASREFIIWLIDKVNLPNADTRETIPPYRFNGAPTSTVTGVTLNVEISLETDEFAICKYDTASGTPYAIMPLTFSNTGLVYHSTVVAVTPNSLQSFYVRCVDDEGNINTDDYLIQFSVSDIPTGQSNTDGNVDGDGTGSGNDGSGDGGGGGGSTGASDGEQNTSGGSSGGGGSGGGGGGGSGEDDDNTAGGGFEDDDAPYQSGDGRVIISGTAYPNADITVLVDGQIADSTTADGSGDYSITLDEIARGAYTFGVYATDIRGVRSSTFSTSFTVTGARTSALSNINIAPSIEVTPDPVEPGETVTFSGFTLPDAEITIETGRINSSNSTVLTTVSDSSGSWTVDTSTSGFTVDTYQVRARAEQDGGERTDFSEYTFYGVGQEADVPTNADLNRDGFVNLIDFSILLFWWNTNGGDSDPPADINRDGSVSLTDFSIMLFEWTG